MVARRFPRYDVTENQNLRGWMDADNLPCRLVTLAVGGCGFYGEQAAEFGRLPEGQMVTCFFEYHGYNKKPIAVSGTVAYSYTQRADDKNVLFCGIEFFEQCQDDVRPLIEHLAKQKPVSPA